MDNGITIKTELNEKMIRQTRTDPVQGIAERVIHLEEQGVREALKTLGWKSPEEAASLKAEVEKEAVTAFAHEIWDRLLATQRTHKVLPLTLAKSWLAERHPAEEDS